MELTSKLKLINDLKNQDIIEKGVIDTYSSANQKIQEDIAVEFDWLY